MRQQDFFPLGYWKEDNNTREDPVLEGGSLITGIQMSTPGRLAESFDSRYSLVAETKYTILQKYLASHEIFHHSPDYPGIPFHPSSAPI